MSERLCSACWRTNQGTKMSLCPVDHKACQCSGTATDPCPAVEALRKEAERYRWLRDSSAADVYLATTENASGWAALDSFAGSEAKDSAVDAAMAAA